MNPPERAGFSFYNEMGGMVSGGNRSESDGEEVYYIGIIDIFTQYTLRKRVEHFVKSLINDGVNFVIFLILDWSNLFCNLASNLSSESCCVWKEVYVLCGQIH